jgi:selenocysteine lyase/cysteine desulfurase
MGGLTRKELLAGAAAAGAVAGCGGSKKAPTVDPRDWASVEAQYQLARGVRYFDAFVLSPHPRPVREAIERHRRGLDADPAGYLRKYEAELDARVTEAAAAYLQVMAGDVALTDSTTMGLGLVYGGLRRRREALTTVHDFYATHEALRLHFDRVRRIRLYDDPAQATVDGIVEAIKGAVRDETDVLALTWVHSSTGVKLPLPEIGQAISTARRHGLTVVMDGVHGLGADDEPIRPENFDVLVAGCHKWLGGPRGTGLVWTLKSWDGMAPVIPSFAPSSYVAWLEGREPPRDAPAGPVFTPGGYHSFEHRWALAEAFAWQTKLGRTRVAERIRSLATRLKQGLEEIDGVKLVTPMAERLSAGIVCFDIDGLDPGQAVERLRREHRVAASVTPYAERHVRFGTGLWVDEADVDAALGAIARL